MLSCLNAWNWSDQIIAWMDIKLDLQCMHVEREGMKLQDRYECSVHAAVVHTCAVIIVDNINFFCHQVAAVDRIQVVDEETSGR